MRERAILCVLVGLSFVACTQEPGGDNALAGASDTGYEERSIAPGVAVFRGDFEAPVSGSADAVADAFLDRWASELGLEDSQLGSADTRSIETGLALVSYPVLLDGVEVLGAHVRVSVAGNRVYSVTRVLPTQRPASTTPTVDEATAMNTAADAVPMGTPEPATLLVIDRGLLEGGAAHLVWEVGVESAMSPDAPLVYVDALDGSVVYTVPRSRSVRDRAVFDMENGTELALAVQQYEESGLIAGRTMDADAEEAFLSSFLVFDYFEATFGRDSGRIESYVHYGAPDLGNAYARSDGRLLFSDGQVTEDIFSHEFTHRIISEETGRSNAAGGLPSLDTTGEPGAVHEAIADVFAMLAGRRETWQIEGERNLENPSTPRVYSGRRTEDDLGECFDECGGLSTCTQDDGTCDPLCFATTCSANTCYVLPSCANDYGYVHDNSTVLSRALFVATREGLDGWPALGDEKMEQILYRTLRNGLGGIMGLQYTAELLIDSCLSYAIWARLLGADDRGITVEDCSVLRNALAEAELVEPDSDFDGWPDGSDNCVSVPNPDQDGPVGNETGTACQPGAVPPLVPLDITVCNWRVTRPFGDGSFDQQGCDHVPSRSLTPGCSLEGGAPIRVGGNPTHPTFEAIDAVGYDSFRLIHRDADTMAREFLIHATDGETTLPERIVHGQYPAGTAPGWSFEGGMGDSDDGPLNPAAAFVYSAEFRRPEIAGEISGVDLSFMIGAGRDCP